MLAKLNQFKELVKKGGGGPHRAKGAGAIKALGHQKAPDFEPAVSPDGLVCHRTRRHGKNALLLLHAAGGAGKLVAQPASSGPAAGRCRGGARPAGGVPESEKREEISPRR